MKAEGSKVCTKCNEIKSLCFFSKDSSKKDGYRPSCRSCDNVVRKKYYIDNKAELNRKNVQRQRDNIEQTRQRKLRYSRSDRAKKMMIEYRKNNPRVRKPLTDEQKEKKKISQRKYVEKNREKIRLSQRNRIKKLITPEKKREYKQRDYNKMMSDPLKKLTHLLRCRLRDTIKKGVIFRTHDVVEFTTQELKNHLEKLWAPGMSWENYSRHGWHIDHIIPCNSFDMGDMQQIKRCWSLSNLQPLWARENLIKSYKI